MCILNNDNITHIRRTSYDKGTSIILQSSLINLGLVTKLELRFVCAKEQRKTLLDKTCSSHLEGQGFETTLFPAHANSLFSLVRVCVLLACVEFSISSCASLSRVPTL